MTTRLTIAILVMICVLIAPACTTDGGDSLATTGTVVFLSFEGGFHGIKGDDGRNYDPVNLAHEFRKEGLRVRFRAKELTDQASFHMWGTMIEILDIQKL